MQPGLTGILPAVLVADDDPLVRLGISVMLREVGLDCRLADGFVGAMTEITAGYQPDLLITDFAMADGNGYELADAALGQLPELKILLVTGDDAQINRLPEDWYGLAKPFVAHELLQKVEEAFPECAQLIH